MRESKQEVESNHEAVDLFRIVLDIEKYPQYIPWCSDIEVLSKKNNEVDVHKCASCVVYFGAAVVLDVPWRVPRLALVAAKVTLAAAEVCFGEVVKYWTTHSCAMANASL